jgi:hypothetical protein
MKKNVVGIVALAIGVLLLVLGFNELGTFGSRAGRMLGAGLTNKVLFLLIAGAACTVYGLVSVVKK